MNITRLKSAFKLILKIGFSVLTLWYVISKIDQHHLLLLVERLNVGWLLPAIIFFILSKIISAYRLNIFFGNIGLHLSSVFNLKLYWLGMFYNTVLPGGVGGDGYKVWFLSKQPTSHDISSKGILTSVLLDRINGLLVLIMILAAMSLLLHVFTFLLIAFIVVIPVLYAILHQRFFPSYNLSVTSLYSTGVQLCQILSVYCIMKSIQVDQHLYELMIVFLISSVASVIPVSIGGAGLREMVFYYAATFLAIPAEAGVLTALLFFLITFVVSLAGLYYLFVPLKSESV
jgi:glycosyltransferase 2 family protein